MPENSVKPREVIMIILTKRPWLLPLLYTIYGLGGSTKISEVRESLGIRSAILKRGLWWLQKYGLITKSNDKILINSDYRGILDELFLNTCRTRNYFIVKYGATYIVISVKRTRISTYTIPVQLVEELSKMSKNVATEFSAKDFSEALGLPPKLAYRVVKTRKLLLECQKK